MRPDPPSSKALLRSRLLASRAAIPLTDRRRASRRVCEALLTLPEVAGSRRLSAFAPTTAEVDILPAIERLLAGGLQVLLPWVDGDEVRLAQVQDLARDLAPGWRGVLEPVAGLRAEGPDPAAVEVAVIPGVGFDRRGNRLGYGGGHFDRLLARLGPATAVIGVAFEVQVVDDIPTEAHDVPVSVLVTEAHIRRP